MPCTLNDLYAIATTITSSNSTNTVYDVYALAGQAGTIGVTNQGQQIGGGTQPASVGNGYYMFIQNMWNNYQIFGCQWWADRLLHWNSQLPINHLYHLELKEAKIAFGIQAQIDCGCTGGAFSCLDPTAFNYSPGAMYDCLGVFGGYNTSCCTAILYGCDDPLALNYNPNVNVPTPYSCMYCGCTDPTASNYLASNGTAHVVGCNCTSGDTSCCTYSSSVRPLEPSDVGGISPIDEYGNSLVDYIVHTDAQIQMFVHDWHTRKTDYNYAKDEPIIDDVDNNQYSRIDDGDDDDDDSNPLETLTTLVIDWNDLDSFISLAKEQGLITSGISDDHAREVLMKTKMQINNHFKSDNWPSDGGTDKIPTPPDWLSCNCSNEFWGICVFGGCINHKGLTIDL